ncbi:hypothetical protein [Paraburkholderia sp. Clong3]|uniref:hypothetical protein n=1 Tax=Paraburkholderia sp. Clong3 TaxID=2991061 RepID=UPI003D1944FF
MVRPVASMQEFSVFQVSGEPYDIGYRLGEIALAAVGPLQPAALLDVLHDRAPSGLPIYRDDPHDPDDENTLATALFEIGNAGVSMKAYRQRQCAFDTFVACATPEPARVSAPAALTRN